MQGQAALQPGSPHTCGDNDQPAFVDEKHDARFTLAQARTNKRSNISMGL